MDKKHIVRLIIFAFIFASGSYAYTKGCITAVETQHCLEMEKVKSEIKSLEGRLSDLRFKVAEKAGTERLIAIEKQAEKTNLWILKICNELKIDVKVSDLGD